MVRKNTLQKSGFHATSGNINDASEKNLKAKDDVEKAFKVLETTEEYKPKFSEWDSVIPDCENYKFFDYAKRKRVRSNHICAITKKFKLDESIIPDTEYIYNANKLWESVINSNFAEQFDKICAKVPYYIEKLKHFEGIHSQHTKHHSQHTTHKSRNTSLKNRQT